MARIRLFMGEKDSIRDGKRASFLVERRASPPGWTGETPVAPSKHSSRNHGVERLLDALLKRLVSGDRHFGISDRFEASFHFEVERKSPVVRGMRGVGFEVETPPCGFIGTDALDDRPGLNAFASELKNAVDLVAAGEGASVENDFASRSLLQQETSSVEHDLHHEVILLDRVFDIFRREQRSADLVFTEARTLSAPRQFAGERGLAGSGKACHEDNHSVQSVAAAELRACFVNRFWVGHGLLAVPFKA